MKQNIGKCHLVVSGYKHEHICAKIGTTLIMNRMNIDNDSKFDKHVLEICSEAV